MKRETDTIWMKELALLRGELADIAFALERRGCREAADVAHTLGARLDEIRDGFFAGRRKNLPQPVRNAPVRALNS